MTYHQSPESEGEQRARDLAVEKHDREASDFDKEYQTLAVEGYLATAFLLGREKIDRRGPAARIRGRIETLQSVVSPGVRLKGLVATTTTSLYSKHLATSYCFRR